MLVALLAADVGLIDLDNPRQAPASVPAGVPQSLQHEPSGLLRDPDFLGELQGRNALAGRDQQILPVDPFVKRNVRALHYCLGANGEDLHAGVTAVVAALAGSDALLLAAVRATCALRPTSLFHVGACGILIGELLEEIEKADGGFAHFL